MEEWLILFYHLFQSNRNNGCFYFISYDVFIDISTHISIYLNTRYTLNQIYE